MNYEIYVAQLKEGKLPNVTGLHFTPSQAAQIETLLNSRKKQMDNYYTFCVVPRIIETSLNVRKA